MVATAVVSKHHRFMLHSFVSGPTRIGPSPSPCPFMLAGMYIWGKLPDGLGVNDLEFCQQLVQHTGIALSPGRGFGPGGVGYVRFALVQPEAVLQQAAETVGAFAEGLKAAHAEGASLKAATVDSAAGAKSAGVVANGHC